MSETLKGCPFCNNSDVETGTWDGTWSIVCDDGRGYHHCEVSADTEADAIEAWNHRAPSPAFEAMREALRVAKDNLQFLPPDDVVEQIDSALSLADAEQGGK